MARRWLVTLTVVTVLAATSCGGGSATQPPAHPLVAVLQAIDTPNAMLWNRVAIADLTGHVRATAGFVPMPTPFVGCAGAVLPTQAYAVAGKVYFASGDGFIRALAPDGKVSTVTSVPFAGPQQMLSFAVSPDGKRVLASVFSLPPKPAVLPNCGQEAFSAGAGYAFDMYAADAGQPTRRLYHEEPKTTPDMPLPNVLALIGWDAVGPLATYPTLWATQGGGPMHYFGVPVRVDAAGGRMSAAVDDINSCVVLDMAANGEHLCSLRTDELSVRRAGGAEIWRPRQLMTEFNLALMSPDEGRIVRMGAQDDVISRDGSALAIPGEMPVGWADANTVIASGTSGALQCISLEGPPAATAMGISGRFVGALRG